MNKPLIRLRPNPAKGSAASRHVTPTERRQDSFSALKLGRQATWTDKEINAVRARMNALMGTSAWQTALSEGMGNSRAIVNGWFSFSESNQHRFPPQQFLIVLEFLEVVPLLKWPKRWAKLKALKMQTLNPNPTSEAPRV